METVLGSKYSKFFGRVWRGAQCLGKCIDSRRDVNWAEKGPMFQMLVVHNYLLRAVQINE
jgi:hypothetical protein